MEVPLAQPLTGCGHSFMEPVGEQSGSPHRKDLSLEVAGTSSWLDGWLPAHPGSLCGASLSCSPVSWHLGPCCASPPGSRTVRVPHVLSRAGAVGSR